MKYVSRILLLSALLLGGCSIFGEEEDETIGWSQQKLYTEAKDAADIGDWELSVKYYEILAARYPFGKLATQSQLNVAYAYFRNGDNESALAAADRFIKLYPRHPATAYAYYLKGIVNFDRNTGLLQRFIPTDPSQRDPGATVDSYQDFAELVRRFPDTKYAEDARKRMLFLRNNLARHEVHVARYYLDRGAYLAAANRAEHVVERFQRTPAVRDALEVMIEAYDRLGLEQLKYDARRVLVLNELDENFIDDPRKTGERSLAEEFWEYLGLDEN